MLVELVVENYAVIERARVRFHRGLNVLTGETGSGKSIIVDALGLLFGGRASADMIRAGSDRARLSGIFEVPTGGEADRFLADSGIEAEDGELIVEREILAGGKSRAFVASRPVAAALLRDLAPLLGDIHGQHDHQALFSPESQRELLDAFADDSGLLGETAAIYQQWRDCSAELEQLDHTEQEKLRMADLWSFQRNEIEAAGLHPNEDVELENERRILKNVVKLQETAETAYAALYDSPQSAAAQIRVALKKLEELARIDDSLAGLAPSLQPASEAVGDVARELGHYVGKLEADPARLEDLETRLAAIDKLKRKYGGSVEEILAFLATVRGQLAALESTEERRAALEKRKATLAADYTAASTRLTACRQEAGRELARQIEKELGSLAMTGSAFVVRVEPAAWSAHGCDAVSFLLSANTGEEPKPLERVASGGELSRVALAVKTCAQASQPKTRIQRTLVFDEVDAGVGGSAGEAVGRRLKRLAASNQVLCVTHLAQIAGFADHHYTVEKRESRGRTIAAVEELDAEARPREIARMLSGHRVTPEALKHAEQLLKLL